MSIMDSHVIEHSEESYLSCSLCENVYTQRSDLEEHQKTHMEDIHGEKSKNISNEVMAFSNLDEAINKTINDVECSYNVYELQEEFIDIKEEIDTYNDDSPDAVELSKEKYTSDKNIECNAARVHNIIGSALTETQVIGKECTSVNPMDLNLEHPLRKQPLTENICAVCNKIFNFQRDLIKHAQDLHPKGKAFKCNNCNLRYSTIPSLCKHNRKIHKKLSRTHVCKFCTKSFTGKSKLKLHLNGHKNQLKYPCSLCENVYNHERGWNRHQMSHFRQESFKCKLCFKAFSRIDSLKRHQRVHTGERPHSCNICGKPYAEKRNLQNHQKTHLGPRTNNNDLIEKPYGCKVCSKSFDFESHLNYHLTSHTKERPFSCSMCSKVYKHRKSLNKHQKIHLKRSLKKFSDKDVNISEFNKEKDSTKTVIENNPLNVTPIKLVKDLDSYYNPCLDDNVKTVKCLNNSNYSVDFSQNDKLFRRDNVEEICNLKNVYNIKEEFYSNADDLETENVKELLEFSKNNMESDIQTKFQLEENQLRGRLKYACFLCEKSFSESCHLKKHQKTHLKPKKPSKIKKEITSTVVCEKKNLIAPIAVSNNNQYISENDGITQQSLNTVENLSDTKYPEDLYHNRMPLNNNDEEINCLGNTFNIKEELSWHSDSQELLDITNFQELDQTSDLAFASTPNDVKENFDTNDLQQNQRIANCKITENCKRIGAKMILLTQNKCAVCYKVFNFQRDLIKHVQRFHPNGKAFKCCKCSKRYSKIQSLLIHCKIHRISTNKNTQKRAYKASLNRHQKPNQKPMKHACKFCSQTFDLIGQLRNHLKLHTEERPYSCSLCNKSYLHRQGLHRHLNLHTEERSYACSLCEKSFKDKATLEKHQKMHVKPKDVKAYACTNCYKSFDTELSLKLHLKMHTGERPYSCDLCGKSYIRKKDLNKHQRKVHLEESGTKSVNENIFPCKYCSRSFDQIGNLKCHLRSHSEERPFACSLCDKTYKHNSHLKHHQKIHLDANELLKRYVCNICSKSFDLMGRLKNHLRSHSEERDFVCSFCEKSFKYKCDLNRHLKLLHSGENPFSCSLCSTSYADKRSFNKHRKVHLNKNSETCVQMSLQDETQDLKHTITGIKEEIYSDSECQEDDMETKSVLEIFKTEYISEEDIINSAVRLEDNSRMYEDYKY